jgi:hypothetical protein
VVDEVVLVGQDDQLCAVAGAQLGHRAADVGLRGGMADGECGGDVGVAQAVRDESDDLLLPGRELRWSMSWPVTLRDAKCRRS